MEKSISTEVKYAVVTRVGDYWVDKEKASRIAENMNDKEGRISTEYGYIAMAQVIAVLTPEGYDRYLKKQNGQWACEFGNWHDRFKQCDCTGQELAYDKKLMEELSLDEGAN